MRGALLAILAVSVAGLLSACVATGYGGDVGVGVGYAGDFYQPCCYDYGGWGGRYRVGPPHFAGGGRGAGGHAPGRGVPSIPSGPRGGSGHRR
jgi:hypothetical protein